MSKGPMTICYHGTNAEAVEKIREEGFQIYTYFARSLQDALGFGGPHILEVVFYDADIEEFGWQFKAPEVVSPDRIVRYYTLEKEMKFEDEELGKRVFQSNMVETPKVLAPEPFQDAWIDEIYNWTDDLFREGKFEIVDEKLKDLDPGEWGMLLSISWLTITAAAKDKLKNRSAFYDRCHAFVMAADPDKDVKGLLGGLE